MVIASPGQAGIKDFPHLAGKRLVIDAHRDADLTLMKEVLAYHGLLLGASAEDPAGGGQAVVIVPVGEKGVAGALRETQIDSYISIIAPSAPKALACVAAIASVFVEPDRAARRGPAARVPGSSRARNSY